MEENERCHSTEEIAALTGIEQGVVRSIERDALTRLQAFVAGKATLGQKNGKLCICYPDAHTTAANTPEQEAVLLAGYDDLQARDIFVTGRSLADAAGTSAERACARLEAQGVHITSPVLAKEAGVAKQSAIDFLTARRRTTHATA